MVVWLKGKDGVSVGVAEEGDVIDSEGRFPWEPMGYCGFAIWPVKCRNGKWRWFRSIEKHDDGTFTLGNRGE